MEQKPTIVILKYDIFINQTEKAWHLKIQDKEAWFPKSQCSIDKNQQLIHMPEWLVEAKELSVEKCPSVDHKKEEGLSQDLPF